MKGLTDEDLLNVLGGNCKDLQNVQGDLGRNLRCEDYKDMSGCLSAAVLCEWTNGRCEESTKVESRALPVFA